MRGSVFGCLMVSVLTLSACGEEPNRTGHDAASGEPADLAATRPLLVVAYDPAILPDLNMGGAVPVDPFMGFVGEVREDTDPVASYLDAGPDEWERRLEWMPDDSAHALVRDSARALGMHAGDTYWVITDDGPVPATVERARAGRNTCGRPGGIAVTFTDLAARLPPGVYYASPDSTAASRARIVPRSEWTEAAPDSGVTVLDADGDGRADTSVLPEALIQRRPDGQVCVAVDPGIGRC